MNYLCYFYMIRSMIIRVSFVGFIKYYNICMNQFLPNENWSF